MHTRSSFHGVPVRPTSLLAIVSCVASVSSAQSPTLDAIHVSPDPPILSTDPVTVTATGSRNVAGLPTFHHFVQRSGAEILVDLVHEEYPVLAPAIIEDPYDKPVELGLLEPGDYDLTVRLFWSYTGLSVLPDPWDFPDQFGSDFGFNDPGPRVLRTSFTVVPEPAAALLALVLVAAATLGASPRASLG